VNGNLFFVVLISTVCYEGVLKDAFYLKNRFFFSKQPGTFLYYFDTNA